MNEFERDYYESEAFWSDSAMDEGYLRRIRKTTALIPEDVSSLLDVGCGNGVFCNHLIETKPSISVVGIDRSKAALKYVKSKSAVGDILDIPFGDHSFECVTCLQVLEHLTCRDFEPACRQLARVSSKYLLISVPYRENLEKDATKCPKCRTVFNLNLHFQSFDEAKLENLFAEFGFSMVLSDLLFKTMHPVGLDSYQSLKAFVKGERARVPGFRSPVCPLCGFENPGFLAGSHKPAAALVPAGPIKTALKNIILPILPKRERPGYWIAALYRKNP